MCLNSIHEELTRVPKVVSAASQKLLYMGTWVVRKVHCLAWAWFYRFTELQKDLKD